MEKKKAPRIKSVGLEKPLAEFPLEIPKEYLLDSSVQNAAETYYYEMVRKYGNTRKGRREAARLVKKKFHPKNAIVVNTNGKIL